jgi:ParB family chromosome partitioning protein
MKIEITKIHTKDRQRRDLGDLSRLKESISRVGLINPIVVDDDFRLVAGERRLESCRALGMADVEVVLKGHLTEEQLQEIEYDENVHRLDLTWQERCLAIAKLHQLRSVNAVLHDSSWGQRETSEVCGCSVGNVNWSLRVASFLNTDKAHPFWKMDQMVEAIRWMQVKLKEAGEAELAQRHSEEAKQLSKAPIEPPPTDKEAARQKFLSNPHNEPEDFETYFAEREALAKVETIHLTPRLHRGDCIPFLYEREGMFDAIVTDPPYGIDMDMLEQNNLGVLNVDKVRATHDVKENTELLARFFPAAFAALRQNGFLVLWCDTMLWSHLYTHAEAAGFKVQRWPLVWVKAHKCMNTQAQFNFTKATEFAMVCRKGLSTLAKPAHTNFIVAAHDEFKEKMSHPFVKPFAVWRFILEHVSIEGHTICDPFAGEGSGFLSALRMNRNALACEIDPIHYNAMLEQVKKYYLAINPTYKII